MTLRVVIATDGLLEPSQTPAMDHELVFVRYDDTEAVAGALEDADAFVTRRVNIGEELLRRCRRLRLIQQVGVGTNRIDLAAARRLGITVANTPGAPGLAVIEHTFLLILAAFRGFSAQVDCVRSGGWSDTEVWESGEIAGSTMGIIGCGFIGRGIARRALVFDARVLVNDIAPLSNLPDGMQQVDLETLLRESDIVVVAAALTPETRGMIGRRELAMMKPSAMFVNVARGAIVDEEALLNALTSGRLWGAGIDAFVREPLPADSPFRSLPNVVATPHSAGSSRASRNRIWQAMLDNLNRLAAGQELRNVVNKA